MSCPTTIPFDMVVPLECCTLITRKLVVAAQRSAREPQIVADWASHNPRRGDRTVRIGRLDQVSRPPRRGRHEPPTGRPHGVNGGRSSGSSSSPS